MRDTSRATRAALIPRTSNYKPLALTCTPLAEEQAEIGSPLSERSRSLTASLRNTPAPNIHSPRSASAPLLWSSSPRTTSSSSISTNRGGIQPPWKLGRSSSRSGGHVASQSPTNRNTGRIPRWMNFQRPPSNWIYHLSLPPFLAQPATYSTWRSAPRRDTFTNAFDFSSP